MATFSATINYPDNQAIDFRDTLASAFGYQSTIDDGSGNQIPNPQTKVQFIQQKANQNLGEWIRNTYRSEKNRVAIEAVTDLTTT